MKVTIPKSVLTLADLCAKDANRWSATSHVRVKASNGRHRCEATNGRVLGIINGFTDLDAVGDILLPSEAIPAIKKMLARDDSVILIETEGTKFSAFGASSMFKGEFAETNSDGMRWPNTDAVLPTGRPRISIMVDAGYLIQLLKCALSIKKDGDESGNTVTLHFYDPLKPFAITARNQDGTLFFDGVAVPLCPTK